MKEEQKEEGIPVIVIQFLSILILVIMFYIDKITGLVVPPLESYWYWSAVGIATGIKPKYLFDKYIKKG